ncbi:MAG: protein-glutamate O-methyltransferase CheR [Gudongella sp.]|nr:protein-glutamate O-methyltransferase CheR [Gudongella sp.]
MELDYKFLYEWVLKEFGIELNAYKDAQMQRRLAAIMRKAGVDNFKDYTLKIKQDEAIRKEFLNQITINVTEFFRNKEKFEEFQSVLFSQVIPKYKDIKIWSAACSNGAEPYSIGIMLHKNRFVDKAKIIASDLDRDILARAKKGLYKNRDIKNIENDDVKKYFDIVNEDYEIKDNVKKMVSFKKHDLIMDKYEKDFHAIICRNVTIYFKNEVKNDIYRKFHQALVPGGIFFIGATEGMYNPAEFGFKKLSSSIYEKI